MPRFTAILEARVLAWCRHLRRRGVLSTIRHLTVQLLRELRNTQEFDSPPSIGSHKAFYLVELKQPHNIAVVSHNDNGEIGFHLFYADPSCYSTWEMSSHHPGPLHPVKELGPDQEILLLSDGYSEGNMKVWAYQYLCDAICPYSVFQPGGRVRGKHASAYFDFDVAIVTDDWKMHRYHAASSGTDPSVILHDTEILQGGNYNLVRAVVFSSRDVLLECSEREKGTVLMWACKFPFITGSGVQYSPFTYYGQGISSPLGSTPLLGSRYRVFTWPVAGSAQFPNSARLVVTGADSFLRIYYYPGTGRQWKLLKFDNGTQLADFYLGPSALYPWDVIAFASDSQEFDGQGDLWLVGVAPVSGPFRAVKIFHITPYIDLGRYTVMEDKTYAREEKVADVMWYRASRRLIHLELEQTGKLRIVLD